MAITTVGCNTLRLIPPGAGYSHNYTFLTKKWNGGPTSGFNNVWTDGANIYYSNGSTQYVKDGENWVSKSWNISSFNGSNVWTDGVCIYLSESSTQYILSGGQWVAFTWSGLTKFSGNSVWSDGANIYYTNGDTNYVLQGTTWTKFTYDGDISSVSGNSVWSDGTNTYFSSGSSTKQYVLRGNTWEAMTWAGFSSPNASNIWTDGLNIYHLTSNADGSAYKLNGTTWESVQFKGLSAYSLTGNEIWTDGVNIYGKKSYILDGTISPQITGISISPAEASVARGETCQFTATVKGDEGCSQEVAFALSGNNETSETTISETGLLEVGADETSETFSVIAYAVDNPDITATATVIVVTPDLRPVFKKTGGKWVKKTAYQMTNGEWTLISTASK